MDIRKQLAITEIKAAVLNVAHSIKEGDLAKSALITRLMNICEMLDDEIQVDDREESKDGSKQVLQT
jgi:hypothetical protein